MMTKPMSEKRLEMYERWSKDQLLCVEKAYTAAITVKDSLRDTCREIRRLNEENDRLKKEDGCPYTYDDEKCMAHQRRQMAVVEAVCKIDCCEGLAELKEALAQFKEGENRDARKVVCSDG